MIKSIGYAAKDAASDLVPLSFERQEPKPDQVVIDILFCGVCHSDIHYARSEVPGIIYPCVPGHEIVGRIARVGPSVSSVNVGDLVGVGCMVDSCGTCPSCQAGEEQYCEGPNSFLATYNGPVIPAAASPTGTNMYGQENTFGGFSTSIVVREKFVLKVPSSIAAEAAGPIMCAGVTTYSPLKHWGVTNGHKVGVVGLGGLGHMAVKLALAMGAEVTVFTTSTDKVEDARRLGAEVVLETDEEAYAKLASKFDFILSTVPTSHAADPFVPLLKRDGSFCAVGTLGAMSSYNNMQLILGRKSLSGSLIGSIAETQEVLDFCAEHGISPDVEMIPLEQINEAFERLNKGDVRFRFVADMTALKQQLAG
jgi:uncharacterized zinc-type alcohol dehydrogenase-like protein